MRSLHHFRLTNALIQVGENHQHQEGTPQHFHQPALSHHCQQLSLRMFHKGAQTVELSSSSPALLPAHPPCRLCRLTRHAVDAEGPDAAVAHGRGEVGAQGRGGDGAALADPGQALGPDGGRHLPVRVGGARFGLAQVSRGRSS